MPRSLRVREECIRAVKSCLLRNGFPSQKILAEDLGMAQSTVSHFLNGKPVDYANFIEICRGLGQEWRDIADFEPNSDPEKVVLVRAKVAIVFEDSANALTTSHHTLSQQLHQALSAGGHEVFFINNSSDSRSYLKRCDYLLLLLSQESAASEMVLEQVQLAKELPNLTAHKPAILPIFLELNTPLSFDLLSYLAGIQPWLWRGAGDTFKLLSQILTIIKEGRTSLTADHELAVEWKEITSTKQSIIQPLPAAAPELPGGQVELTSGFYIDRPPIESRCYETIAQPGALIRIKAPRQMGKTSLMARILHRAEQQGSRTVALSFQLANRKIFANSDTFLQWFCASIGQ